MGCKKWQRKSIMADFTVRDAFCWKYWFAVLSEFMSVGLKVCGKWPFQYDPLSDWLGAYFSGHTCTSFPVIGLRFMFLLDDNFSQFGIILHQILIDTKTIRFCPPQGLNHNKSLQSKSHQGVCVSAAWSICHFSLNFLVCSFRSVQSAPPCLIREMPSLKSSPIAVCFWFVDTHWFLFFIVCQISRAKIKRHCFSLSD